MLFVIDFGFILSNVMFYCVYYDRDEEFIVSLVLFFDVIYVNKKDILCIFRVSDVYLGYLMYIKGIFCIFRVSDGLF